MTTWLVGRHGNCDLVIDDPTVSRRHANLCEVGPQLYLLDDLDSTSGTFVLQPQGWRRITSSRVRGTDRVRFGAFETSVEELLHRRKPPSVETGAAVERDPETGAIVVRRR